RLHEAGRRARCLDLRAHVLLARDETLLLQLGQREAHGVSARAVLVAQLEFGGQQGADRITAARDSLSDVPRQIGGLGRAHWGAARRASADKGFHSWPTCSNKLGFMCSN